MQRYVVSRRPEEDAGHEEDAGNLRRIGSGRMRNCYSRFFFYLEYLKI
jgi:hypothetical protein